MLEQEVNSITTTLMGTEEFAKAASLASSVQLRLQKVLEGHMARQLSRFNMPSRDDLTALGEQLLAMDDRLARIEEMLGRIVPQQTTPRTGRPPRTKKTRSKSADAAPKTAAKKRRASPKPDQQK